MSDHVRWAVPVSTSPWLFLAPEMHGYLPGLHLKNELPWKCKQKWKSHTRFVPSPWTYRTPSWHLLSFHLEQFPPRESWLQTGRLPDYIHFCNQTWTLRPSVTLSEIAPSPPALQSCCICPSWHLAPPDTSNVTSFLITNFILLLLILSIYAVIYFLFYPCVYNFMFLCSVSPH